MAAFCSSCSLVFFSFTWASRACLSTCGRPQQGPSAAGGAWPSRARQGAGLAEGPPATCRGRGGGQRGPWPGRAACRGRGRAVAGLAARGRGGKGAEISAAARKRHSRRWCGAWHPGPAPGAQGRRWEGSRRRAPCLSACRPDWKPSTSVSRDTAAHAANPARPPGGRGRGVRRTRTVTRARKRCLLAHVVVDGRARAFDVARRQGKDLVTWLPGLRRAAGKQGGRPGSTARPPGRAHALTSSQYGTGTGTCIWYPYPVPVPWYNLRPNAASQICLMRTGYQVAVFISVQYRANPSYIRNVN